MNIIFISYIIVNIMINNIKKFDSDITKFKYKMTGEFVVHNSETWVFDVSIYHNEKLIYVIGFSPNQIEGAVFSQLGTYKKEETYSDDLDTIKKEAKNFIKNLDILLFEIKINQNFNYANFHKVIEQNKLKLWQQESTGFNLYKKPNKWFYWITKIIPKLSKEVMTKDTSEKITCTNINKHDTVTFYTFTTNSNNTICEAIYYKKI